MILSHDEETIIAQCTPQGSGAIALVRISGVHAIAIADRIAHLASKKTLSSMSSHTIHYGWIINEKKEKIDQVLFLLMRAPNTFTGQDTVEITCHNNIFLIEQIIALAINNGARLAQSGEFSRRSFLNNKIDLIQAEAINELINAQTQQTLKKSMAQLNGTLSGTIEKIEKQLIKALAFCEASFEFIDEEIQFGGTIASLVDETLEIINAIISTFDHHNQIKQGIRIAFIGSVNTGKSSLFNALLNQQRAIVTNIAGTTRDSIEAGINKNGNHWTLVDTAGLRQTDDIIEQEGIARSLEQAHKADIVLLVFDGSRQLTQQEHTVYQDIIDKHLNKIIFIRNKSDLHQAELDIVQGFPITPVSAHTKTNISTLENAIDQKIGSLFASLDLPFLLNKRQFLLLQNIEKRLKELRTMLVDPIQYELVSCHLNDIISQLSELTGKSISEAGMDAIFREFCVGK